MSKYISAFSLIFISLLLASPSQAQQPATTTVAASTTDAISRLQEVEAKIKAVAEKNTAACVAISDGVGSGSGVIISKSGLVMTAGHVMVGSGEYQLLLADGRTVKAVPLGKNLNVDAGLVKITDKGPWPYVELGETTSLKTGDWVVSLGHSGGFELGRKPPVRSGRILKSNGTQLTTDAVLIGGDSGGPLFDLDGKLVAIHSSIGDSIAENRHVRIEIFQRDFDRMRRGERWGRLPELADNESGSKPPKIGVRIDRTTGVILSVKPNSPADQVGIKQGDQVLAFDGTKILSGNQLINLIKQRISGDVARMKIQRGERIFDFEIRLR